MMLEKCFIFLLLCCLSDTSELLYNRKLNREPIAITPIEEGHDSEPILVNGRIYKTFKKYYCSLFENVEGRQTLLYGRKGWTFPRQDVNLTLVYPSTTDTKSRLKRDFVITGYQLILFTDGVQGGAYINSGGILQDTVSMSFISQQITTLSYQFWLYGAKRTNIPNEEPHNLMC